MKSITILAKNGSAVACLTFKTSAEWIALDINDIEKMKDFQPNEVFEISIGSDENFSSLRQGCKVDFAYITK